MSDQEAWHELCSLYLSENEYSKAAFCMEEVLLHNPHSHLIHQRLAEIRYTMVSTLYFHSTILCSLIVCVRSEIMFVVSVAVIIIASQIGHSKNVDNSYELIGINIRLLHGIVAPKIQ